MNGTEKQIKWAEDIKTGWINELNNDIEAMEQIIEKRKQDPSRSVARFSEEIEKNKQAIERINAEDDAAKIIEMRGINWFDWKNTETINQWQSYLSK